MRRFRITARMKQNLFMRALVAGLAVNLCLALAIPMARAKTYVIRDGDRTITYTTFATDPARVLGQAGMELSEQDSYTTEPLDGAEAIHIRRVRNITVEYHGKTVKVTSYGETAGELLHRLRIVIPAVQQLPFFMILM